MLEEELLDEQVKKKKRRVLLILFILLLVGALGTLPLTEVETPATAIAIEPGTPFPSQTPPLPLSTTSGLTPSSSSFTPTAQASPSLEITETPPLPTGTGIEISTPAATTSPTEKDERTPTISDKTPGIESETELQETNTPASTEGESSPSTPDGTSNYRGTATATTSVSSGPATNTPVINSSTPPLLPTPTSVENSDTPEVETVATRKPGATPTLILSITPSTGTLAAEGTPVEVAQPTSTSTPISQGENTPVKEETPVSSNSTAIPPLTATLVSSTPETSTIAPDQLPVTGIAIKRELSWPAIGVIILLLGAGIGTLGRNRMK